MDIKRFKKTYKFICDDCGEFMHTKTEFCEKCGSKALRKPTREDYAKFETKDKAETAVRKAGEKVVKNARIAGEKAKMAEEKAEVKAERAEKKAEVKAERAERKAEVKAERAERKAE